MAGALALLGFLAAFTSRSSAQSWTVLRVQRDARSPVHIREAAGSAVATAPVFGPAARMLSADELRESLPSAQHALLDCVDVDCAGRLARAAELAFVAVVAIWPGRQGTADTVSISLVRPDGTVHEADAPIGNDVAQATTSALVAAARELLGGRGVRLRIRSRPVGALVLLDGLEVGVTPYEGAHARGMHEVTLRLRDRQQIRRVRLESTAVELDIAMGTGEGGSGGTDRASSLNLWLAASLAAAALVSLAPGLLSLAQDDDQSRGALLLASGITALSASAYIAIAQPFRIRASLNPDRAHIDLNATF